MKQIKLITFDLDDTFWDIGPVIINAELTTRKSLISVAFVLCAGLQRFPMLLSIAVSGFCGSCRFLVCVSFLWCFTCYHLSDPKPSEASQLRAFRGCGRLHVDDCMPSGVALASISLTRALPCCAALVLAALSLS